MSNTRYLVDEKNINNINFELLYISKSTYGTDWHSTSHFHPFIELFFITSGKGIMEIDDKVVSVKEGDLVIINPNCPHTEKSSFTDNTPLEYIVFGINNLALAGRNGSNLSNNISNLTFYKIINFSNDKEEILYYLNKLVNEVEKREKEDIYGKD